jgi:nitrogen regulatory protein PII
MDTPNSNKQAITRETVKLISCVINSDKSDKELLQALYDEQQIIRANSINCRGYASLYEAKSKKGKLPRAHFSRLIEVIVSPAEADTVFEFIFHKLGLDKPGIGVLYMSSLDYSSHFSLPKNMPVQD